MQEIGRTASSGLTISRTANAKILFNPFDKRVSANPYPHYQRLRTEEPVHWSRLGAWFIGCYDDVKLILRDRRFRSRDIGTLTQGRGEILKGGTCPYTPGASIESLIASSQDWLPFQEGEDHKRIRLGYTRILSRSYIDSLRPYIRETARAILHEHMPFRGIDIVNDFARLIPIRVMSRIVGVDGAMAAKIQRWSRRASQFLLSYMSLEDHVELDREIAQFTAYLTRLSKEPRSDGEATMLGRLFGKENVGTDALSESQRISVCLFAFVAGMEAVENLIGNSVLALVRNPDQTMFLMGDNETKTAAVDELARYDSPLQLLMRVALEDVEVGGKTIRQGDPVYLVLGSANRDPAKFSRPDELVLNRRPNHHLSFGDGHHLCVGAHLARVQGQEALGAIAEMTSDMKLEDDQLDWGTSLLSRGLRELPVKFTPR